MVRYHVFVCEWNVRWYFSIFLLAVYHMIGLIFVCGFVLRRSEITKNGQTKPRVHLLFV